MIAMTTVNGSEASSLLASGLVCDFQHAMALVQVMCLYERQVDLQARRESARELGLPEPQSVWLSDGPCEELRQQAKQALVIYTTVMDAAITDAIERMRAAGLGEMAEALESGNYEGLAI